MPAVAVAAPDITLSTAACDDGEITCAAGGGAEAAMTLVAVGGVGGMGSMAVSPDVSPRLSPVLHSGGLLMCTKLARPMYPATARLGFD